ncbi:uncharacterized protein LOC111637592 [Centruroides sculpturatus]|uniref:uncharacterized protein LOC111637592 n=1 Tax=Centruroides sculpturatus TaxID=218467 RepID=UPI000C6CC55B|nr:uncharacterized protein LOC111637592 [Centruroides sculpturatus]
MIEGNLNEAQYIQILEDDMLPSVTAVFGEEPFWFVHDCFPVHTARLTSQWMEEHPQVQDMGWPGRGADLNPIDNIWVELCREPIQAATPSDLWQVVQGRWEKLREGILCLKCCGNYACTHE